MGVVRCWNFSDEEQPSYPTIEVTVSYDDREAKVNAKVDTGFNGWLAIGREAVRSLRLKPAGRILVKTAVGNREVSVYRVNLSQPDLNVAYATIAIGTERSLVGRGLLENRRWLLDCEEHRFCITAQTTSNSKQ